MITKKKLEILLSKLKSSTSPKIMLEQYTTSPKVASELLFLAGFVNNDIKDKNVLDMGSGNGCLAIGAKIMGAKEVTGIEIDNDNIKIAQKNAATLGVEINWINSSIDVVLPHFDTIIMNPPFGTRREHADKDFLQKAMELGDTVYSIHKKSTRQYLIKYIRSKNREVDTLLQMQMEIPYTYEFHIKKREIIEVDLFRIIKR